MEHDVVFADEVYEARVGVFPPLLPIIGQQLFRIADVAYGGVEPHVEHLAFGAFYRHGDSPVQVAAHGAGLQPHVQPALALPVHVGTPLLVVLQYPLAQPGLVLVQGQVPVGRFFHHRLAAADGALGVNQLRRAERGAALLALVAIRSLGVAAGAFARDVAVGQEGLRFLVVILHGGLFDELPFVIQFAEEVGSRPVVYLRGGASVHVERDAEFLERLLDELVVTVHDVLRCAALLLGADGDGHAVLVASADEEHLLLFQAQVSCVNVGRHVDARQVSYVYRPVGVGQRRGDGGTFEFLFHIVVMLIKCDYFAKIRVFREITLLSCRELRLFVLSGGRQGFHRVRPWQVTAPCLSAIFPFHSEGGQKEQIRTG